MESEIVITGMSGRFPESDSVSEFANNLYNKVDLLTEDDRRWEPGLYGIPRRKGQLKDISKFDNHFFGVHNKQAHYLDPQARVLLESAHESIIDAGYDPEELKGMNIGVFIGNSLCESVDFFTQDHTKIDGYGMIGSSQAMFANLISNTFDFKGPSLVIDTACSSGVMALYEAVRAIQSGVCEAAIVGGANLTLRPCTSLMYYRLNILSYDGSCKSFDAAANGYGRSEAIVTLFVQKADVARRKYATIVHIKTNTDGYKEQGVTYPSAAMQKRLIKEVYEECKLDPLKVSYLEAHAPGTPVGDPIEISAVSDIFCPGREEPLLVGSVKSNMGHSEATSGLCSVVKVLLSMENGLIPPNLHFYNPNPEIEALVEGRVKVVTNPTPLSGGYAAVNSFGFGGVNVHAVLKSNTDDYKLIRAEDSVIPQLALYNGRTKEGVKFLFDYLDTTLPPRDFFALLHKSAFTAVQGKPFRGYKLLGKGEEATDIKKVVLEKRPLWYIFSGMGTQWPCMAKQLMNLEVFAKSIMTSAEVLKPYGLDLIDLVTNRVKDTTSNARSMIPAFVSIAAVQVALVDVLNEIGLKPDGVVGHSVGELGCAYTDGGFTAEQMLLAAYWRGKAVEESNLPDGAMAAVGMTWSQANECCPKDVFPSCHNAEDSVTISGPKDSVKVFVDALEADNVFAREVDSCGYAFHSQYILPAAGKLQAALEKVIPNPKPRSNRWVSSSYKEDEWDDPMAKLCSASYFVHNLVSPVLFHEALHHVPKDAIVVEIAPHHLLQAILKRVIGPDAEYIGLMRRNVDNTVHLLSSLGRLYTSGLNPDIEKLYPSVPFPVAKGTPMISSLIKWDHSESWTVAKWGNDTNQYHLMIAEVNVGPEDSPDHYLLGHCVDGRFLYPGSGYLVLAWRALAEKRGKEMASLAVNFEDVKIHRATILSKTESITFLVITTCGGEFEISESGTTVCTGRIYSPEEEVERDYVPLLKTDELPSLILDSNDIYKELKLCGYDYGPTFQGVTASDLDGNKGLLKWTGNWVVFLDSMLHYQGLSLAKRAMWLPTRIRSLKIDPALHKTAIENSLDALKGIPLIHDKNTKRCIAGGVELKNSKGISAPRHQGKQIPLLEEYHFLPYNDTKVITQQQKETLDKYIHVCSSIAKMIQKLSGNNGNQVCNIMNGFKEADDAVIANYLKSYTDNHVLLKSLCGIMNTATGKDLTRQVKKFVNSYLSERDNDILFHTMLKENPIRPVVDVVVENFVSRKLKIAEVCDSVSPFSASISEFVQTAGVLNVNYTIAHSQSDIMEKDKLPVGKFEVKPWNIKAALDWNDMDLFVMKFLSCSKEEHKKVLEDATAALKDNGFLALLVRTKLVPAELFLSEVGETEIPIHSEKDLEKTFIDLKLQVISKKTDSLTSTLYLLRKAAETTFEDVVIPVFENKYEKWVDVLREKMVDASDIDSKKRLWLVSEGTSSSGIVGLVNCLRQEPGGSSIRCVFTTKGTTKLPDFDPENKYYQDLLKKNLVMNVFKRDMWGTYRHLLMPNDQGRVDTKYAYLTVLTRGDLSSLVWVDSPLKFLQQSVDTVLCQVYYAPLNFKDVMLASRKLAPDATYGGLVLLGIEFSGRLDDGQRIMGIVSGKGLATAVVADPSFVWQVPDNWTLEEASTVPVAYSTAYYALVIRGSLQKGERVLIHSGSGGVGQAAIAIALSMECEVFTTVGSPEKREFLKKRFSQLRDRNFCNSRDTSFEAHILNATHGEGVDIVLNSLADEKLKASLHCLAQHGRFLEIGKYDLSNDSPLGMAIFLKNIAFHGILMDGLFERNSYSPRIVRLVSEGIKNGTVQPLNSIIFNSDQAEQAFRFMASGKHMGKVVLKIRDEEPQKKIAASSVQLNAIARTIINPAKSCIIIGGLGGFGLELCHWLLDRGAKHIILTSRSGVKSGYQKLCVEKWRKGSINVVVSKLNAAKSEEAKTLLKTAASHGPVAGIFNLALVLKDAFMENQTVRNFVEVSDSKVASTKNLDSLSRDLCPHLEYFVCFSSLSCGRGNAGQSNYGYANSVMERICEDRCLEGLPGLAIQWGAIGDVGVIEDTMGSDVVIGGTVPQRINSCLNVLDKFLQQRHSVVSSFVPHQPAESGSSKASKHNVMSTIGNIFGIKDMSSLNPETTLGKLGMDSLMGVEVKQFLERDCDLVLSIPELRQLKVKDLKALKSGSSTSEATTPRKTESGNPGKVPGHFGTLPSKQLVPDRTIVPMNSVSKGTPLFIVHPIEGTVTMLGALAQLINVPVYGLQYTPEAPSDSIQNLGAWYWKHIQQLDIGSTVHLSGYSFGASVAFNMCLQAEKSPSTHPSVSSLVLLDGSPAIVTALTREYKSHFVDGSKAEAEAQAQALCLFAMQFMDVNMREFKREMFSLPTFANRVKFAAQKITSACQQLDQADVIKAFDLFHKRLLMTPTSTPLHKLQKEVSLIKSSDSVDVTKTFSDAYNLEKECDGKITVHTIKGTHMSFILDKGAEEVSNLMSEIFSH